MAVQIVISLCIVSLIGFSNHVMSFDSFENILLNSFFLRSQCYFNLYEDW